MSKDSVSPMLEAAIVIHGLFLDLVNGGFTETQALRFLAELMSTYKNPEEACVFGNITFPKTLTLS